jgi:hypothetical protein
MSYLILLLWPLSARRDDSLAQIGHRPIDGEPIRRILDPGSERGIQGEFPPWVATSWVSHICLFSCFSEHQQSQSPHLIDFCSAHYPEDVSEYFLSGLYSFD